ncbi:MMPL family transporter [Nocardioides zeae]|uniref:MMPL family transporter n=1 Tax=Nocardioides imazamoxiresistens TaxID=3231893 RepID=A0ABU3PVA2_9ACTN|nr:MMPL family transporter [Nocardioides zeae]MDT9593153.1 MMPL family transporter [Nocardioides zeae]
MVQASAGFRAIVVGRRTAWLVALLPLLLAGLLIGLVGEGERERTPLDGLPAGLDSTYAAELAEELPESDGSVAVVLFTADSIADEQGALEQLTSELTGGAPTLQVAEDDTAAIAVVPVDASSATEVGEQVTELRDRLASDVPDGVEAQVTGPAGIEADLAAVFEGANFRLLAVTAIVVALLLVITYRSPVLWVVPLTVVGVADRLAAVLATHVLAFFDVAWDESTIGILSVLVFGAGSNYALLLISRYRDELRTREDRREAMAVALRHTAEAVLTSAFTVVAGVLTLLLSLTPTTRGLGLACGVGILVAAAFVLVVLPAALVGFGRWIFWPKVPHHGDAALVDTRSAWRRVGDAVARKPWAYVAGSTVLLAAMAAGTTQISAGLDTAEQFLDTPEAITASERIGESFPAGTAEPTQVLTRADPDEVLAAVEDVPGIVSARPSAEGGGVTQIDVTLDSTPGSAAGDRAVEDLRSALATYPDTHVGGAGADALDETDANARDRLVILPMILGLVLLVLGLLLRSVLAPLILGATVVATYAAALGVSWWIFTGLLGFENLAGNVPLFAFLFLVALGIDYNIFLVTRTREEARSHGIREGVLRALGATGGVITSAGILLAAVFAVLGVLPLVVLAQLGVVICIGVLLDTLLVRTVVVPAIIRILGDRFWWPRRTA